MRVSFLRGHSHCISTPVRVGVPAKVCLGGRLARRNCKRSLFDPTLFCSCALGMSPGGRWCLLSAPGSKPAQCCFRGRFLVLAVSAAGCAPLFLCVAQRKGRRGENKKIKSWVLRGRGHRLYAKEPLPQKKKTRQVVESIPTT